MTAASLPAAGDPAGIRVCFVGLENLPVLAREYNRHRIGGEQVQQTLLSRALARRGYQVSTVVGDYGQADGASWDGVRTWKAYRFDAGIPVLRFIHPRWTKVWAAIRRADADVYYSSCADILPGMLALFARRQRRTPGLIFRIAHDSDCDPDRLLIRYWRDRRIYEYGLRHTDVILAQSEQQQMAMRANYARESVVASMMVDAPERRSTLAERDLGVLWVNNIRQFKRPDLALQLAAGLEAPMHMVGGTQPGFESLYVEIERQARQLPNLVFHGAVPYHDVNDLYGRARVFVNTSDTEGFPNSYLQAWVRGTPVVSFFDPDRVIEREGLGLAVRNPDEMRAAVQRLLQDDSAWRAASERCLAYMARAYDEDRILEPYLTAIRQLAASRQAQAEPAPSRR